MCIDYHAVTLHRYARKAAYVGCFLTDFKSYGLQRTPRYKLAINAFKPHKDIPATSNGQCRERTIGGHGLLVNLVSGQSGQTLPHNLLVWWMDIVIFPRIYGNGQP